MDVIIKSLTNEELKLIYKELLEWIDTGDLKKDGIVRRVHLEICEKYNYKRNDFYIGTLKEVLLFEIARRTVQYL